MLLSVMWIFVFTAWNTFAATQETCTNGVDASSSSWSTRILEDASLNQGLALSTEQRRTVEIDGLLPFGVRELALQSKLVMHNIARLDDDLERYRYLMNILELNEKLFYHTLIHNLYELMPIVYTPTVGTACKQLGYVLHKYNHGVWLTAHDIGRVEAKLAQWPNKHEVKAIVVTDGERILGLGDLGAFGMGIPIGKIALYTAIGGISPSQLLPIHIDAGTNNEALLHDDFYFGVKQRRSEFAAQYDVLLDEFMQAVHRVFGETTLVQFEDFGNSNAFRLLQRYRDTYCTFNDDIQGTAAVTMAGIYASLKGKHGLRRLREHRFLMIGAGSAGIGIADIIAEAIVAESSGDGGEQTMSMDEARQFIWLMDSKGLIFEARKSGGISSLKRPYAHRKTWSDGDGKEGADVKDIAYIVGKTGATAIIGVSGQPGQFTKDVILALKQNTEYPLVFSLSNPTSMSECSAQQAYDWAHNKLYFASGSPFKLREDTFDDGRKVVPSQGNNAYIFPGVALGIIASQALRVPNDLFLIAAQTVANLVDTDLLDYGVIYPPIEKIREVSVEIAIQVAKYIHDEGLTKQQQPSDFRTLVTDIQYNHHTYD